LNASQNKQQSHADNSSKSQFKTGNGNHKPKHMQPVQPIVSFFYFIVFKHEARVC
jgi:hypothetical protein